MLGLAARAGAGAPATSPRQKLFVGVQVRKQSFDERGIGEVIDDLISRAIREHLT
jgi:hypothetical protein